MESMNGQMVIDLKGNGGILSDMAKVLTYSQMVTYIWDNISMAAQMVMVNIVGQTEIRTVVFSKTEKNKAMVFGKNQSIRKRTQIIMKVITKMI